jgi:opacity protein-like surface antigen
MTRKLLSAAAVMASVLLTGAIAAQAADVTFGGENLTRYELRHQSDSGSLGSGPPPLPNGTAPSGVNGGFFQMRTRLNANVKVDENISAFTQFQMVNIWGGQLGFDPNSANDTSSQVGLHQAYITLKNPFGAPLTAQIGRQEVILDAHRLFGNTLWTMGAQSHDGMVFA